MRASVLLPLLLLGARADDDLTTCAGAYAAWMAQALDCAGEGSCDDGDDGCTYGASVCGPTTTCATSLDTVMTGIDDIVTGFLSCTGDYANLATYGGHGADYLQIELLETVTKCELGLSDYYDSTTCAGTYAIIKGYEEYCACPEVCEYGTGQCDDNDSSGYCTGECNEDYSDCSCGTSDCSTVAELYANGFSAMATCTGTAATYYGDYATYYSGTDYLTMMATNKMMNCGLTVPSSMIAEPDTCLGAIQKFSAFDYYCDCDEVCTGGSGQCDDDAYAGYCTGQCVDSCDPTTAGCGTAECQSAGDEFIDNWAAMGVGFPLCATDSVLNVYQDLAVQHPTYQTYARARSFLAPRAARLVLSTSCAAQAHQLPTRGLRPRRSLGGGRDRPVAYRCGHHDARDDVGPGVSLRKPVVRIRRRRGEGGERKTGILTRGPCTTSRAGAGIWKRGNEAGKQSERNLTARCGACAG